jgi:hypothetical protein
MHMVWGNMNCSEPPVTKFELWGRPCFRMLWQKLDMNVHYSCFQRSHSSQEMGVPIGRDCSG